MTLTEIQKLKTSCEMMLKRMDVAFAALPGAEIKLKTDDAKEIYMLLDKLQKVLIYICDKVEVDIG